MIPYLYFYITITSLLFFSYVINNSKYIFGIAILLTLFFSGFRLETGYDWFNYVSFYSIGMQDLMEPFFALSVKLLNLITDDFRSMFFCYSLATVSVLLLAIHRFTKRTKISFLLYLLIPSYFITSFSIVRQGLALVIFLYALSFLLIDNNRFKFILISIVSCMFHYSAAIPSIMLLLCEKIFNRNFKTIYYVLLVLISWVLYYANIAPILITLAYGRYATYIEYTISVSSIKILVVNLFAFAIIAYKRQYVKSVADTYMLNMLVVGTLITNIFADFLPMTRLSYYFFIVQIVLVPKIIYSAKHNITKAFFLVAFLSYYILMLSYSLKVDIDLDSYPKLTPYNNIFL